jgi:nucleoside-diphosphate-sugar epimerase
MTNIRKSISIIGCGWLGTPLARHFIAKGWEVHGTTTSAEKIPDLEEMGIRTSLYRLGEASVANGASPTVAGDAADVAEAAGESNGAIAVGGPYVAVKVGETKKVNAEEINEAAGESNGTNATGMVLPKTAVYVINIPPSRIENYADKVRGLIAQLPATARQILFCSSTSVYADTEGTVTETDVAPGEMLPAGTSDPARHGTPRSVLLEAEGHAAAHPATTILRLAGLIGGERNPARFLAGRQGVATPLAPVNLIHLNDIIAVIDALVRLGTTGEVFNVCAREHPTRKAYYTDAALKAGLVPPVFDDSDTHGGKTIDSSKIEQYTGLKITQIEV